MLLHKNTFSVYKSTGEKQTAGCGFTLIELLVVIVIIALLLAIIMPALRIAKELAGMAICLSNQRQVAMAWIMYAEANDSTPCGPNTTNVGAPSAASPFYAYDRVGPPVGSNGTVEEEIRGIRNGTLYPYYENPEVLHCPSDKRFVKPPTHLSGSFGGVGGYRTYSLVYHLNTLLPLDGSRDSSWAKASEVIHRTSEIQNPGSRFILIEENDNRGLNVNGWVMNIDATPPGFVDPFGIFHNKRSTLGYADGHCETTKWKDPRTMQYSKEIFEGRYPFTSTPAEHTNNPDIEWLKAHYPRKR